MMNFNPNAMFFFLSQTLDDGNTLHCCETLYFKRVPELKQKIKTNRPNKTTKKINAQQSAPHLLPPEEKGKQNKTKQTKQTNKKQIKNCVTKKNCWKGEINIFELKLKLDFVSLERMRE